MEFLFGICWSPCRGLLGPARVQSETCVSQRDRRPHGSRPGGQCLMGWWGLCTVSAFHTLTGRCLFRMEDGVGWVEGTCFLLADDFRNRKLRCFEEITTLSPEGTGHEKIIIVSEMVWEGPSSPGLRVLATLWFVLAYLASVPFSDCPVYLVSETFPSLC